MPAAPKKKSTTTNVIPPKMVESQSSSGSEGASGLMDKAAVKLHKRSRSGKRHSVLPQPWTRGQVT